MPYEQLIQSVDECAEDKCRTIKERTTRRVAEIHDEAAGKEKRIKQKHEEAARTAVEKERGRSVAQVKKETRMQLVHAKDEVYQKAFTGAKEKISRLRTDAHYASDFTKMLQEAARELEGESLVISIDKRDEALCKKLVPELNLNCRVVADITTDGGLDVSTKDGRFIIKNTIESRLERAKVLIKPEIFATLYGDQGGV
ncbi:MAG: V-type ATP synthase subunit E [Methanoregula sp.]|nr:V-type ATP synthase subunit E [Methanoregula sp.]